MTEQNEPGRFGAALDRTVGNTMGGWVSLLATVAGSDPAMAALIGGAAGVFTEELSQSLRTILRHRSENVRRMLGYAATESEQDIQDLLDMVSGDRGKTELLTRACEAAARSAVDLKLELLARVFTVGAQAVDRATVDDHIVVIDALAAIDVPHIRLLLVLRKPSPQWWTNPDDRMSRRFSWPQKRIIEADPGLRTVLDALTAKLDSLGMARSRTNTDSMSAEPIWELTEFGRLCIRELADRKVDDETWEES